MKNSTCLIILAAGSVLLFYITDDPMVKSIYGISVPIYCAAALLADVLEKKEKP